MSGCQPAEPPPSKPDVSALKAQLRQEVRAELEAERAAEASKPPSPTQKPALSKAERAVIARAKGEPAPAPPTPPEGALIDEPIIVAAPAPGTASKKVAATATTERPRTPTPLGAADRAAARDDPAARGLKAAPPRPEPNPKAADRSAQAPPAPRPAATPSQADQPRGPASRSAGQPLAQRRGVEVFGEEGGLRVVDMAVGTDVQARQPVGAAVEFRAGAGKLICFTVVRNGRAPATVSHVWRRDGKVLSKVELNVGTSPKWRTWSRQRVRPGWTGDWSCEVLAADGAPLARASFRVVP